MRKHVRFVIAALLLTFVVFSLIGPTPTVSADTSTACQIVRAKWIACGQEHGFDAVRCKGLGHAVRVVCPSGSSSS